MHDGYIYIRDSSNFVALGNFKRLINYGLAITKYAVTIALRTESLCSIVKNKQMFRLCTGVTLTERFVWKDIFSNKMTYNSLDRFCEVDCAKAVFWGTSSCGNTRYKAVRNLITSVSIYISKIRTISDIISLFELNFSPRMLAIIETIINDSRLLHSDSLCDLFLKMLTHVMKHSKCELKLSHFSWELTT
jgi:hypothetical protein